MNNQQIDAAVTAAEEFLSGARLEPKSILRIKLTMEEALLKYQDAMGQEAGFALKPVKRFGKLQIELSIPGGPMDPFAGDDEESGAIMRGLLAGMGLAPTWQYKNGANLILFTPQKKKPSQFLVLLGSIVLAVACGFGCLLLPVGARTFLANDLVEPVFNTFMGLLSAVAGPMIFLSVAWGIYSIGDTATLGRIGKRMIGRFLVMSVILTVIVTGVYLPFFPITTAGGGNAFNFRELFEMVLDIIPGNFFTPFTEGNPIQIIFVAILIGMAILILGNKAAVAAAFIEQANYIVQLIMEAISSLVPLFVFGSIFNMILSGNLSVLSSAYKLLPLLFLGDVVSIGFYLLLVCARKRVSPKCLLQKVFPTFLIGLTTASSAAAFATNVECCEKDLGIDKKIINFGVPLGQVVFMPGCVALFLSAGLCMAQTYDVAITPGWLLTAMLITIVLAVAAPPVPGGALTCYTMLFLQLKIPAEAIAITIALNVVLEFVSTAVNLLCLQTELVELAGGLGMLDTAALRKRKVKGRDS